eukprot:343231-Pleurochrysis_carterae.AAC.2
MGGAGGGRAGGRTLGGPGEQHPLLHGRRQRRSVVDYDLPARGEKDGNGVWGGREPLRRQMLAHRRRDGPAGPPRRGRQGSDQAARQMGVRRSGGLPAGAGGPPTGRIGGRGELNGGGPRGPREVGGAARRPGGGDGATKHRVWAQRAGEWKSGSGETPPPTADDTPADRRAQTRTRADATNARPRGGAGAARPTAPTPRGGASTHAAPGQHTRGSPHGKVGRARAPAGARAHAAP